MVSREGTHHHQLDIQVGRDGIGKPLPMSVRLEQHRKDYQGQMMTADGPKFKVFNIKMVNWSAHQIASCLGQELFWAKLSCC